MFPGCRRCGQTHDPYAACPLPGRTPSRPKLAATPDPGAWPHALVGSVIADRYRVNSLLGQGATGAVFAVEHVSFPRPAAMKVLRPRHGAPELVSRVFYGEARAAWSVSHACLCEVFDIGNLAPAEPAPRRRGTAPPAGPDPPPFFVMERLEGETLASRIARERMSIAAAVDMMMQLLSALDAIHARDLLARDLRPKNVFLAERRGCRPVVKLLDFGLARLTPLERIQQDWSSGPAHGTPGSTQALAYYLPPERTHGEHAVEPASDLFVAAAIFYEALTGERPFSASSFDGLVAAIRQGAPVPLHERRPDVSPDLSAFVSRALAANPRARPSSAKEMQDELRGTFELTRRRASSTHMLATRTASTETTVTATDESTFASIASPPLSTAPTVAQRPREIVEVRTATVETPPTAALAYPDALRGAMEQLPDLGDLYNDETETRRERHQIPDDILRARPAPPPPAAGRLPGASSRPPSAGRSITARPGAEHLDEASAENTDRTVPPPPRARHRGEVDESMHVDPSIEVDMSGLLAPVPARRASEDDETETRDLDPALRAHIERLMTGAPALPETPASAAPTAASPGHAPPPPHVAPPPQDRRRPPRR